MYYTYILTNATDKVLYIGMTNDLKRRIYEHKRAEIDGFTKRYKVNKLVYFEEFRHPKDAIKREKQLKSLLRVKKNKLVETINPDWKDLTDELFPNEII